MQIGPLLSPKIVVSDICPLVRALESVVVGLVFMVILRVMVRIMRLHRVIDGAYCYRCSVVSVSVCLCVCWSQP